MLNAAHWKAVILNTTDGNFWGIFIAAIIVSCVGFYFAFGFLKRARVIDDTPTSKVRSAAQGYVELVGRSKAMDGPPILSPLTNTVCTWYRYSVEEIHDKHTRTLESGASDNLFYLVGPTGKCVIDPEDAIVKPSVKKVWYGSRNAHKSSCSSSLLGSMGSRYRYTEERMHDNDPLYAIGEFKSVGGNNSEFNTREDVKSLLASWKNDPGFLLEKFDKNKDGEIDIQEWDAVRNTALKVVKKNQSKIKSEPMIHLLSKPKMSNKPFILSTKSQRVLIRTYRMYAAGSLASFFVAGIVAVWMVGVRFS